MPTTFDFGGALQLLRKGAKVSRHGWNGQGMRVMMQKPDEHSKMQRPYLYMSTVDGTLIPRSIDTTSALADDWYVVE